LNVLVTGGAGYIGSVITEELIKEGNSVVVIDNLQQGHREAVSPEAEFVQTDLADTEALDRVFRTHRIDVVVHMAAESIVPDSVTDPMKFFNNNIGCGLNLLDTMIKHDVLEIIFSSTAAVYGEPSKIPIEEKDPVGPVNAYGESKLMFERILHRYGNAYGLKFISLRYFNAAGASERFGEDHSPETHLIPNILKVALGQEKQVSVFGNDYPTRDGSCIRDYIHVVDIAREHILPLKNLKKGEFNKAYNIGNGSGFSVLEVIETARKVTASPIPAVINPRREGDPAVLVAFSELAKSELGWKPVFSDLETIIDSAWQWQKKYPYGYRQ